MIAKGYKYGRKGAIKQTNLPEELFPSACPYTWESLMDDKFPFVLEEENKVIFRRDT